MTDIFFKIQKIISTKISLDDLNENNRGNKKGVAFVEIDVPDNIYNSYEIIKKKNAEKINIINEKWDNEVLHFDISFKNPDILSENDNFVVYDQYETELEIIFTNTETGEKNIKIIKNHVSKNPLQK